MKRAPWRYNLNACLLAVVKETPKWTFVCVKMAIYVLYRIQMRTSGRLDGGAICSIL